MAATYLCFLLCLGAGALVGQAIIIVCGGREWSRLAPAVGLAALCPLAWWTVRLPGEATTAMVALGLTVVLAAAYVAGRVTGSSEVLRRALPIGLAALALASLPFIAEWRFGILGTGLNPDMSQHLFAADRLAVGASERLISGGYPLGPHSIVVALSAIGPSSVHAFDGLTLAVAVATCLAPLALLERLSAWRRVAGALCVGLAYLVAAYLVQGSFKETMQALFVLAFAIGLGELARDWSRRARARALRALPLAVLAIGSVYTYSFPGLLWLGGALGIWIVGELAIGVRAGGLAAALGSVRAAASAALAAVALLLVAVAPEIGRIFDFAGFETFDPDGAGLGNLFNRISPLEALGIWPSGDFRVEPGDGAVPAVAYYAGAALGLAALVYGLVWWLRRGERVVIAALAAAGLLWLYALVVGTPYQEAKALVLAAPLVALISVRAMLSSAPTAAAAIFLAAAGGSSALALANGPVGPAGYSPELAELRPELGTGSTVVLAPSDLLDDQHGRDYLVWELRGNRICVVADDGDAEVPAGAATLRVALDASGAVVADGLDLDRRHALSTEPCPLIPAGARADPGSAGG